MVEQLTLNQLAEGSTPSSPTKFLPQEKFGGYMVVGVAQLVRAQDCGSWGRGFKSRHLPHSEHSRNSAM